jgi:hypothetical protein
MTCAHFLDFDGPALKEIAWLDVRTHDPIARMSKSWGPPGDGGKSDTQRVIDLRSDYHLLPVSEAVPDDVVLDLDPRALPEINEPIWFPDKDPMAESGYQIVSGKVVAASAAFHTVELDRRIKPVSQSGSPIISQRTGKVLGIRGRVMMFGNGKIHLYLVPSRSLLDRLEKEKETPALQDVVGHKEGKSTTK